MTQKRKNLKLKLKIPSPEIQNQFECSGTSEFKINLNWEKKKIPHLFEAK